MTKPGGQKRRRAKAVALAALVTAALALGVVVPALFVFEARLTELERAAEAAKAAAPEAERGSRTFRYWYHDPDDPLAGVTIEEEPAPPKRRKRTKSKPTEKVNPPTPRGAHTDDPLGDFPFL
jgi:hypothetical protein